MSVLPLCVTVGTTESPEYRDTETDTGSTPGAWAMVTDALTNLRWLTWVRRESRGGADRSRVRQGVQMYPKMPDAI